MKRVLPIILLSLLLIVSCSYREPVEVVSTGFGNGSCLRFLCGNDVYSGSGNLTGMTIAAIVIRLDANFLPSNPQGWNHTQTFNNGSVDILWPLWYASGFGDNITEANLRDTYTQSAFGVNANWSINTAVSDEGSELWVATVMNLTWTQITQFMNYLDVCNDLTASHLSEGPWGTSWICSRNGSIISKNDENSASDATARFAFGFWMAALSPTLSSAEKVSAYGRAYNITKFSMSEEWVTSCQNSTVNSSTQLCRWHLAGAAQAYGGAALQQVGQQMFFGYHESDIQNYLACYAATHDVSCSSAARNETHQFLYAVGFKNQGNTSGDFNYTTGGAHYYMNCTGTPGICITQTTSGSSDMDDADAPRLWETCNNVNYAKLVYNDYGESLPWEFVALERYCQAWSARIGPTFRVASSGLNFSNTTSSCYRITNAGLCSSNGLIGTNSYREAGWVSNMVAYQENRTFYLDYMAGTLSTYSNVTNTYGTPSFGVYNSFRTSRSLRAASGFYDFVMTNDTFNWTKYQQGLAMNDSSGGGGSSVNSTAFAGAINVTVYAPINGSALTQSTVLFNVTLWNLNNTDISNLGNSTIAVCRFTNVNDTCNATGGTLNTTDNTYNSVANFQTWTFGPFNQTRNNWTAYNITAWFYFQNSSNDKWYPQENTSSTSFNPHPLFDISSGRLRVREEPGFSKSVTGLNNSWERFTVIVNRTGGWIAFYNQSANWSNSSTPPNTVDGNYMRFALGGQLGMVKITNITFTVPPSDVNSSSTTGNSTMNITLYWSNGTIIYQQNGTTNGSNILYNVTGVSNGNYNWYVTVRSKDNTVNYTGLNYSVSVNPSSINATLCSGILSLVWNSNISRGFYDPKTKTYNESFILPVNNSVCGYTYKVNNTGVASVNVTFSTNYTNPSGNFTLFVNGSLINASSSKSFIVPAGGVLLINESANLTRWPVLQRAPSINVSVSVV